MLCVETDPGIVCVCVLCFLCVANYIFTPDLYLYECLALQRGQFKRIISTFLNVLHKLQNWQKNLPWNLNLSYLHQQWYLHHISYNSSRIIFCCFVCFQGVFRSFRQNMLQESSGWPSKSVRPSPNHTWLGYLYGTVYMRLFASSTCLSHSRCFSTSSSTLAYVMDKARWCFASTNEEIKMDQK